MAKYHVPKKGGALVACEATEKSCPLEHFEADSAGSAQSKFEAVMTERHGETSTFKAVSKEETAARNQLSEMLESGEIRMPEGNPESSSWSIANTFQKIRYDLAKQVVETGEARLVVAAPGEPGDGEEWTDEEYKDMQEKYADDPEYVFTDQNVAQILNAQQVLGRMPKTVTPAVKAPVKVERVIPLKLKGYFHLADRLALIEDRHDAVYRARTLVEDPRNSTSSIDHNVIKHLPKDIQERIREEDAAFDNDDSDEIRHSRAETLREYERSLGTTSSTIADQMDRIFSKLKKNDMETFRAAPTSPKRSIADNAAETFRADKNVFKDKKKISKDELFAMSDLSEKEFNDNWDQLVQDSEKGNVLPHYKTRYSVVQEFHLNYTADGVTRN